MNNFSSNFAVEKKRRKFLFRKYLIEPTINDWSGKISFCVGVLPANF
jgi:hypothetical protein